MLKRIRSILGRGPGREEPGPAAPPPRCRILGAVNLVERNGGRIVVHPSVVLNSVAEGYHVGMPFGTTLIADRPGATIEIGENCRIHGAYIHAWKRIAIGRGVLIAAGTNIVDSNGHSSDVRYARFRRHFGDEPAAVAVGDYAWIGMNCAVMKGVEIGECAIVAAGSVVKESVPPFSVAEGNPARVVRRFDPAEALAESFPIGLLRLEKGFYEY